MNDQSTKPFPGIAISLAWVALYLVLQLAMTVVATVVVGVANPEFLKAAQAGDPGIMKSPVFAQAVLWGLVSSGVLVLGAIGFHLRPKERQQAIGLFAPSRLPLLQTIGAAAVLILAAMRVSAGYAKYVVPGVELQEGMKDLLRALSTGTLNMILKVLTIAVLAPIVEEVIFRGYLQNALSNRMNGHVAIWLAAFVFAIIHFQPYAIPALMVLGAAFGYLYRMTGSLKTCILLHMLNNGLALTFTPI